jgi:hypothetical protein
MLMNHMPLAYPYEYQHYAVGDSHRPYEQAIAKKVPSHVIKHCWNPNSHGFDVRWLKSTPRGRIAMGLMCAGSSQHRGDGRERH